MSARSFFNEHRENTEHYLLFSVFLLIVGTTITIVQYKVPSILEPLIGMYGMTMGEASWLMSIFTAAGVFLSLPAGSLAKRIGPKRVLLLGCAVIVLGGIVGAFAGCSAVLIASRLVEGIAFVFITVAAPLAIERYVSPKHQGTSNGIWSLWICFGSAIASTATPVIFDGLGMRLTWLLYAALVVVAAIGFCLFMKIAPKRQRSVADSDRHYADCLDDYGGRGDVVGVGSYLAFLQPRPLMFFFAYLIFNVEILAVLSYTPTFLQAQGMDASLSGFASSLPGMLAIVSSPLFGKLVDKTAKTKSLYITALSASIPATFLMLTQSGPLLWAGAILMGFIGYGVPVVALTALPQMAGSKSLMPVAVSLFMLVQCLGEFLGSFLVPILLGPSMAGWVFCASAIAALGVVGVFALVFCRFE